ncbi:MAG TPA: lysine 5,6-aminomutase subunit alpha, partial [Candidatus Syntrophosphaera sp.]|nr:lysine 5,6-aminomutase subunit alpha [Candidatus Syntrophosphaera sp.]
MLKLEIDPGLKQRARSAAAKIAGSFNWLFDEYSSLTIERTVLRFLGIDGALKDGKPLPNVVVDHLHAKQALANGTAIPVAKAMLSGNLTAQSVAEAVGRGDLDLTNLPSVPPQEIFEVLDGLSAKMLKHIRTQRETREQLFQRFGPRRVPAIYVIVATGNIYEDVVQAKAAAAEGADIIAVIRSTAQSLLDYVPYGATTVGFGGTYATQENFRIMRAALDEVSEDQQRYISLTNYASGLCMPEIAAMGAMERLDLMLNDAMYG